MYPKINIIKNILLQVLKVFKASRVVSFNYRYVINFKAN